MSDVVAQARRPWRRLGVAPDVEDELAAELRGDIDAAAEDGVDAMALVGGDPDAFARSWASARGAVRPRWRLGSTATAALLGMIPGAAILVVVPLAMTSSWFIAMAVPNNPSATYWLPPAPLVAAVYGLGLVAIYSGALLAASAWLRRHGDPARPRTLRLLAMWLPVILVVDGVVSRAFDGAFGRSAHVDGHWRPLHMWPLLFIALLALGIAAVRWWAVHSARRPEPTTPAEPKLEPAL